MTLQDELRTVAAKLRKRHPGLAQTSEDVARLFYELRRQGFAKTLDQFMTADSAGRPAHYGLGIAAYFTQCAEELDHQ